MNRSCISTQECSSFSLSIQIAHFLHKGRNPAYPLLFMCVLNACSQQPNTENCAIVTREPAVLICLTHLHCCYVNVPSDLFSSLENLYAPLLCLFFIFYFFMYCWGNSALCYSSAILLENVWIHCQLGVTIPLLLGCFPTYTISTDWTVPGCYKSPWVTLMYFQEE